MSGTTKRTRSQLAVPDVILQLPLSRSPFRDARTALRSHSQQHTVLHSGLVPSDRDERDLEDSDEDEILLSPRKKQKMRMVRASAKRPSSPVYGDLQSSKLDEGRDRKRPRRDSSASEHGVTSSDIENTYDEDQLTPTRATTTARKPVSASATMEAGDRRLNTLSRALRSYSVPLNSTEPIPHIDFRKLSQPLWHSPVKEKWPIMRITGVHGVHDDPQGTGTTSESREVPRACLELLSGEGDIQSSTQIEVEAEPPRDAGSVEKDDNMTVDASAGALSNQSPYLPGTKPQMVQMNNQLPLDIKLPSTPRPFNLTTWPEMSPLTPLLETPFPHRLDGGSHGDGIRSNLSQSPVKPTEGQHSVFTEFVSAELQAPEAGASLDVSHSVTLPSSFKQGNFSRHSEEARGSSLSGPRARTLQATSLAKVLGPKTAAKISSSYPFAPGPSKPVAGLSKTAGMLTTAPALARSPKEKLKARMKMREKPLSAFPFAKTRVPATGRVTRSGLHQKKVRSRSASVGPGETVYAAIATSGVVDFGFDASLFMTTRGSERSTVPSSSPKKHAPIFSEASTSGPIIKSTAELSKTVASLESGTGLSKPKELLLTKPISPLKSKAKDQSKPLATLRFETTRPATLMTHAKSRAVSPTKASLARAASTALPSSSTTSLKSKVAATLATARGSSSLTNLSKALEKLKVPHPVRPNTNVAARPSTSLGFNREVDSSDDMRNTGKGRAVDDEEISRAGGRINRAQVRPSSQSTLAAWISTGNPRDQGSNIGNSGGKSHFFVAGNRLTGTATALGGGTARGARKVSRNPGLPSVMASPVKGHSIGMDEGLDEVGNSRVPDFPIEDGVVFEARTSEDSESLVTGRDEARGLKPGVFLRDTFRRASLASQALSQSLSEMNPVQDQDTKRSMGPPALPGETVVAQGSSAALVSNRALRSSTRLSAAIVNANVSVSGQDPYKRVDSSANKACGQKSSKEAGNTVTLSVLKNCRVFVDVRTDDGDDAGTLFVQMLRDLGAKILTRVGQTCTHIVFKNGLMSTLTRYRLSNDPKPKVVGIAWVVECVEQRQKVDELKFKVELEGMNVAGVNKRQRSMLLRHVLEPDGINSPIQEIVGDLSSSSTALEDLPLEKARMRKGLPPNISC